MLYSVANVDISEQLDLAEFSIDGTDCPCLVASKPDDLAEGSLLLTIGNPSGLTSGVFSGFREDGKRTCLQTDAPINPGNHGGPLIHPQEAWSASTRCCLKNAYTSAS